MSQREVGQISPAQVRDAIEIIATAERTRTNGANPSNQVGTEAANDALTQINRPRLEGHNATVDRAMGRVELPSLIDLKNSVQQIRDGLVAASDISVEISATVLAVMDEELLKIDRYIELRDR